VKLSVDSYQVARLELVRAGSFEICVDATRYRYW
jgi:hypothetical protein